MNRFFSKLNLQDIKINPEGNRFPPDEDEHEHAEPQVEAAATAAVPVEAVEADEPLENSYAPTWSAPAPAASDAASRFAAPQEPAISHDEIAHGNGHATDATVSYGHAADVTVTNGHAADVAVAPMEIIADGEIIGVVGEVLKVSARSRPSAVAGAIAGVVRESGRAEVQAIGAGATNQAVKAVAIARDYLSETGIEAICLPAFIDVTIENEDRTAIRLVVEPR